MNERDQADAVMAEAIRSSSLGTSEIIRAILAAGYRKPRTISTTEDLKTVYEGAVLRDVHGDMWSIDGGTGRLFAIQDGSDDLYDDNELELPAVVVYEPEPTA